MWLEPVTNKQWWFHVWLACSQGKTSATIVALVIMQSVTKIA
jgi:hypothetical protein